MLARLHVQNFKCLRDVDLAFGPFTVLIGPNDSGKSSILDALRILGRTMREPLADIFRGDDEWRHLAWKGLDAGSMNWALRITHARRTWYYDLEIPPVGPVCEHLASKPSVGEVEVSSLKQTRLRERLADHFGPPGSSSDPRTDIDELFSQFAHVNFDTLDSLATAPRFRLNPESLRTPALTSRDAVLSATGDNLAAVLDRILSGPDRTAIARLETALHAAIPTLSGIALPSLAAHAGTKTLEFVLANAKKGPAITIPCAHASDGAMLLTAFLALAFSDEPGLILVEEPENGLHPTRLQEVVELLRKISTGAVGNTPRQIIVTTHSPLLLNYTQPEEVRIVQRDRERGTIVTPMSDVPDVHKLLDEFGTGELWYLLGEQALVEGKKP
ncbi:AAA family ATPase [Nannocystis punicea]|uniref:ATP-binding protein n=1 Tax=Nannocystis punicea TaxID=2995304 RepID=A0ABY7HCA9_9BACT|nr:ATP-binding protein [Nannocystis poenicansa]WAS96899.1 ATP-binding protein [Nannocystis poenicansa]